GPVLRADDFATAIRLRPCRAARRPAARVPRDRPWAMTGDGRQHKERSMRKGFFASVAALAAGAGVALGQGYPTGPAAGDPVHGAPPGYPTGRPVNGYPTAGMSPAYPAGPPAYPAGAEPPA